MCTLIQETAMMDPVMSSRTVREFTDQPVSDDMLQDLLKTAMSASSAGDQRPWHFVVIRDLKTREWMEEALPEAFMVTQAPLSILLCGDLSYQKHVGFWALDCAAATENIVIGADHLGLGAIWLGIYPIEGRVQQFRTVLNLPKKITPFSLVVVGYPAERRRNEERYIPSRIHYDGWLGAKAKAETGGSGKSNDPDRRADE